MKAAKIYSQLIYKRYIGVLSVAGIKKINIVLQYDDMITYIRGDI